MTLKANKWELLSICYLQGGGVEPLTQGPPPPSPLSLISYPHFCSGSPVLPQGCDVVPGLLSAPREVSVGMWGGTPTQTGLRCPAQLQAGSVPTHIAVRLWASPFLQASLVPSHGSEARHSLRDGRSFGRNEREGMGDRDLGTM